jgi:hypothetical protein
MKIGKISLIIGVFILQLVACADPDLAPIVTFDSVGKGAFVRLLKESTRSFNFYDIPNASYTYSVEFVDVEKGAQVKEYVLEVTYTDKNTAVGGDKSKGPLKFKTFTTFADSPNGYKGVSDVKIAATDLINAVGLKTEDIGPSDVFAITGSLVLNDGSVYKSTNSSAAVNSAAFKTHFNYSLAFVCPSSLEGTYIAKTTGISTDDCCKAAPVSLDNKTVTLTAKGGGIYEISDFSAGLYYEWYDVYGVTASDAKLKATIADICGKISGSFAEYFDANIKVVVSGTAAGNGVITYTWKNGYNDEATVTLTKK